MELPDNYPFSPPNKVNTEVLSVWKQDFKILIKSDDEEVIIPTEKNLNNKDLGGRPSETILLNIYLKVYKTKGYQTDIHFIHVFSTLTPSAKASLTK